jgi:hypothetical protein
MKETLKIFAGIAIAIVIVIFFIQGIFLLAGPTYKEGTYTMVYRVYFPNNPRTYTVTNEWPIGTYSSRGTNYVQKTVKTPFFKNMYSWSTVHETSAPIEVVSYTFKEK